MTDCTVDVKTDAEKVVPQLWLHYTRVSVCPNFLPFSCTSQSVITPRKTSLEDGVDVSGCSCVDVLITLSSCVFFLAFSLLQSHRFSVFVHFLIFILLHMLLWL